MVVLWKITNFALKDINNTLVMEKKLFITIISVIFALSGQSQSFTYLWKQVEKSQEADMPKTQLELLATISDKAQKEQEYGHLLKAEAQAIAVQSIIAPDSLDSQVEKFADKASRANDVALKSVYNAVLGHIYKNYWQALGIKKDSSELISVRYYKQAMAPVKTLAKTKAKVYEPLFANGTNSLTFNDDLLHVIGMEAEDYRTMAIHYRSVGNRPAACLSELYQTQKGRRADVEEIRKSKYLATIDSLIHEYRDLPEAGELAIEHFNFMEGATDASAQEKIEYIDYALVNWPTWPRMNVLRNARSRITLPSFNITLSETLAIPNKEIPVYITSLVNIQQINMDVYKVDIPGTADYNPNKEEDYKVLRSKMSYEPVQTDSRIYYGQQDYRAVSDTMSIKPLPVGVYVAEFNTDNKDIAPERILFRITNLRLVDMGLPGNTMRLVAVDATTGKPVPNARIRLKFSGWEKGERVKDERTLITEQDGEVSFTSTLEPNKYSVATDNDQAFPWQHIWRAKWRGTTESADKEFLRTRIYTDRAIYRPGHTVKMSVLAYSEYKEKDWDVKKNAKVHLVLRNSKNVVVAEKDVVTDEWGVGSTEFVLPADGPTGYYNLRAKIDDKWLWTESFKVEEYKQPTFLVTIDEYKEPYKDGDTIIVNGHAKTYSGVAVQNAKVKYSVSAEVPYWFRNIGGHSATSDFFKGEATTDGNGSFKMKVPVRYPKNIKKGKRFANVKLQADVTDNAGESHSATANYPLSDRKAFFMLTDFNDKQCRENQKAFQFTYVNNAGKDIDATLAYSIDGGAPVSAKSNTDIRLDLTGLSSGQHTMQVVCEEDTVSQKFIVFSLKDTTAPVDTAAWYYSTSGQEHAHMMTEGEPEFIQLGTSRDEQTFYYAIASDSVLLESGQLVLSNMLVTTKFEYKEEWGKAAAIRYSWVRDGKLYSFAETLCRPQKSRKLDVEWKTFRDKLTPGDKEEWTLSVKNPDGSPANAHVMAVLYDKSLDALRKHYWRLDNGINLSYPFIHQFASYNSAPLSVYGEQKFTPLSESQLEFTHFNIPYLYGNVLTTRGKNVLFNAKKAMAVGSLEAASADQAVVVGSAKAPEPTLRKESSEEKKDIVVRENLNPTAFFMPNLVTDKNGNVSMKFTLPESLTTWRFMSIAHDKSLNVGTLEGEIIAQKKLMIKPNMPRFIRENDKAQISAMVSNISGKKLTGKASIRIIEPESQKTVYQSSYKYSLAADSTTSVTFVLPDNLSAGVYVCRITAESGELSDGEQNYLPIISNKVEVTTTKAFTQTAPGKKTIDLKPLYGNNASEESLRVDYTDNPAWLMLESLPTIAEPDAENAISLATALYANQITEELKKQLPNDTTLAKEQGLSAAKITEKLKELQNNNGSFSWFKGMRPSRYVTQYVAKLMARSRHIGLPVDENIYMGAMKYLDGEIETYVERLKKQERDNKVKPVVDDFAMDYLYIQTVAGMPLDRAVKENSRYLLSLLLDASKKLTIYGKANMAVAFASHPAMKDEKLSAELLESVRQYSVSTEEMGRYFDTPKAEYSWRSYKIPTQTAAIEALQTLAPEDKQTIAEMQLWLLQEKRTQQWDTPINTASAIYAFFNGWNLSDGGANVAEQTKPVVGTRLFVDGNQIAGGGEVSGKGHVSETLEGRHASFVAEKSSDNISWGAVYAVCSEPMEDVKKAGESVSITREILDENGNKLASQPVVGQKVKVRLTVVAKRDLDFLEVTDNRPACLEPVRQLSGYAGGYYVSPLDNRTVYYFDHFAKGKQVVETEYYVDRAGSYRSGIAEVKCTYAPEYQARDKSLIIETK